MSIDYDDVHAQILGVMEQHGQIEGYSPLDEKEFKEATIKGLSATQFTEQTKRHSQTLDFLDDVRCDERKYRNFTFSYALCVCIASFTIIVFAGLEVLTLHHIPLSALAFIIGGTLYSAVKPQENPKILTELASKLLGS